VRRWGYRARGWAAGRAAVCSARSSGLSGGARIACGRPQATRTARRARPGVSAAFKNAAGGPSRAGGALARQDVADVGATGDQGARAQRAPCSGCRERELVAVSERKRVVSGRRASPRLHHTGDAVPTHSRDGRGGRGSRLDAPRDRGAPGLDDTTGTDPSVPSATARRALQGGVLGRAFTPVTRCETVIGSIPRPSAVATTKDTTANLVVRSGLVLHDICSISDGYLLGIR